MPVGLATGAISTTATPLWFPRSIRRRAPQLGEDNAEVLGELGLDAAAVNKLRSDGTI